MPLRPVEGLNRNKSVVLNPTISFIKFKEYLIRNVQFCLVTKNWY